MHRRAGTLNHRMQRYRSIREDAYCVFVGVCQATLTQSWSRSGSMRGAQVACAWYPVCCRAVAVTPKAGFLGQQGVPSSDAREQQDSRSNPRPLLTSTRATPVSDFPHNPRRSPLNQTHRRAILLRSRWPVRGLPRSGSRSEVCTFCTSLQGGPLGSAAWGEIRQLPKAGNKNTRRLSGIKTR